MGKELPVDFHQSSKLHPIGDDATLLGIGEQTQALQAEVDELPKSPYLLSALAAQRLAAFQGEVRVMYVAGVNAQLAVGRSGHQAAGFERIAARLNDLAMELCRIIEKANQGAVQVGRVVHRLYMARKVVSALDPHGTAREGNARTAWRRLEAEQEEGARVLSGLKAALKSFDEQLDAAMHLVVNSRVEAAKLTDMRIRAQIDAVAEEIQRGVERFRGSLDRVRPVLTSLAQAGEMGRGVA